MMRKVKNVTLVLIVLEMRRGQLFLFGDCGFALAHENDGVSTDAEIRTHDHARRMDPEAIGSGSDAGRGAARSKR